MSLTVVLTPGYQFAPEELADTAKFNLGFAPTIQVTGNLSAFSDYNAVASVSKTFTTFDLVTDILTVTAHGLAAGQRVTVSSTTTLPTGLSASYTYFARPHAGDAVNRLTLHYTYLGAINDADRVDISSAGSGTHTLTYTVYATGIALIRNSATSKWEYGIVSPASLPEFVGATTTAPGTRGAVPQPGPGAASDYLGRDGTLCTLPDLPDVSGVSLFTYLNLH
jgi:hypothetical protein